MTTHAADVRDGNRVERVQVRSNVDETKASLMTTEFWAMLAVIAAILIAASRLDQFTGQ